MQDGLRLELGLPPVNLSGLGLAALKDLRTDKRVPITRSTTQDHIPRDLDPEIRLQGMQGLWYTGPSLPFSFSVHLPPTEEFRSSVRTANVTAANSTRL